MRLPTPGRDGVQHMSEQLVLLAPQHAAGRIHRSVSRLRQLEALGELKAIRDSAGRRLYLATEVEAFVRKREAQRRSREQQAPSNAEPPQAV
jgi:hypothetical protein